MRCAPVGPAWRPDYQANPGRELRAAEDAPGAGPMRRPCPNRMPPGGSGRQLIEWNQVHLDVVRIWIILSRRRLDGPPGGVVRGGEDEYGAIGPKFSDARDARDLGSPDVDGRERHRDAAGTLVAQGHALR